MFVGSSRNTEMDVPLLYLKAVLFIIYLFGNCENIMINNVSNYDTIVVGLGSAGARAASELARAGRRVLALEAQDRVGGRVMTVPFGDGLAELGAEWIHGERPCDAFDIAIKNNISILVDDGVTYWYCSNGSKIETELFFKLLQICIRANKATGAEAASEQFGKNKKQYITAKLMEYILLRRPELLNDQDTINDFIRFLSLNMNIIDASGNWSDASAYSEYRGLDGNKNWCWHKYGYKTYFELMLNTYNNGPGIPSLEIKLSTEVTEISWAETSPQIRVTCKDGNIYTAGNIIFTGSVGVLKERHATLFTPALPQSKIDAINQIPIGVVIKIFISFAKPWWPRDITHLLFIWRGEDLKSVPTEDYWTTRIFAATKSKANRNALTLWISGENAKLVEKLPEDLVKTKIMAVLRKFLGVNTTVPEPTGMIRSSWYSNPFTRGIKTYDTVDMILRPGSRHKLAAPILDARGKPRVLFAGEALHELYFGTVHGAAATGYREAKRLLKTVYKTQ